MAKPGRNTIILGGLAVVAVLGWLAWDRLQPAGLPAGFASANGRIEATEIDIAALTGGRIAEITAAEGDLVKAGYAEQVLTVAAADNTLRLLPPLTISDDEIAEAVARLDRAAGRLNG